MPIIRRLWWTAKPEKGQTMILVAVVFVVLVGMGAMAVDVGGVLWSRGAEQNAADAAALAGVKSLPGAPDVAQQVARNYAASNGFTDGIDGVTVTTEVGNLNDIDPTINDPNGIDTLTVTITRTVQPGLRAAVGGGNIDVPAQAVAVVASVKPQCGIWPFGVDPTAAWTYNNYINDDQTTMPIDQTYGQEVVLKVPSPNTPGNFLAIQLDSAQHGGARSYEDSIKYGGCLPQSSVTASKTGNMVGPTLSGVEETTVQQGLGAITNCVPCWDPGSPNHPNPTPAPDNVYWHVSPPSPPYDAPPSGDGNAPGPHTITLTNPATGQTQDFTTSQAYGLGCPCSNGPTPCPCSGPPTWDDPFPIPAVNWDPTQQKNLCSRVGIVPLVDTNTWNNCNGTCTVNITGYAAFYLTGMITADNGNQAYVVGAYLPEVKVDGLMNIGQLDGPVNYFLWK